MKKTKVLIVDDDADIVFITRTLLAKEGFEVIDAADGVCGLKKILEESPDIVLLDIMMPGMDGYEVCSKIKGGELAATLPIVMLTAKTGQSDIDRGYAAGVDEYITKPFEPSQLLETIWRLTQQSIGVDRRWRTTDPLMIQDAEVRRFVSDHLHSLSEWTALEGFAKTPDTWVSATETSGSSATSDAQVRDAVEALVRSGALVKDPDGPRYRISDDPEMRSALEKFLAYTNKMDARLRIICMILEGNQ